MSIARPTGRYAEKILDQAGWPDIDEDALYDRAREHVQVLQQVTEVLQTCQHLRAELFDTGVWSGTAAAAANLELSTHIGVLTGLQNSLATVITWHRHIAAMIGQTKSDISDNLCSAERQIRELENGASVDAAARRIAIRGIAAATRGADGAMVAGLAERILASNTWTPPNHALASLLDQRVPPPTTPDPPPSNPDPPPTAADPPPPHPAPQAPSQHNNPASAGGAAQPPQPTPSFPQFPGLVPPPAAYPQPAPGISAPDVTPPPHPGAPPARREQPVDPAADPAAATPPAAMPDGQPTFVSDRPAAARPGKSGKGVTPASTSPVPPAPDSCPPEDLAPSEAPVDAPGPADLPSGAAAGPGAGTPAPAGQTPSSGPPITPSSAATRRTPAGRTGPTARSPSSDRRDPAHDGAAMGVIPVASARAEREAIAEASDADAARRQRGGTDPLLVAQRIAAALNAPDSSGAGDWGFFWLTAVTTDGAIVVANSYGIAYIPDGLQLPEPLLLASADPAIPALERARWATFPMRALRGWADHHNTTLRAVVAAGEQLAGSDPGVATIVLKPDDIPAGGDMPGRSRLQVVDPAAADRLAGTADPDLISLLPAAPADVDGAAFEDQRGALWMQVFKPMVRDGPGRIGAHLRAFHYYAVYSREVMLRQAHTAGDPDAQRVAIADWWYWKHLTELFDAAFPPRIER